MDSIQKGLEDLLKEHVERGNTEESFIDYLKTVVDYDNDIIMKSIVPCIVGIAINERELRKEGRPPNKI